MTETSRMTETGAAEAEAGQQAAAPPEPSALESTAFRSPRTGAQSGLRGAGLAALGLAPADLDAHRADPAVPAGRGQRAGVAAAAAGHRPGGGAAVLRLASRAGPVAGPAVPVQRVRGALVRGHLPAAVPLAGRLRGARAPSGWPARPGRCRRRRRATWPGCRSRRGTRPGRTPRAALAAATAVLRRRKFRLRTGDGWVSAEKGYRREPGNLLFHLALLGAARRGRAGRAVRLQGQPAAGVRHVIRQHGDRAGRVPPGPAGVLGRPAAVHHHAEPVRGQLRHSPASCAASRPRSTPT